MTINYKVIGCDQGEKGVCPFYIYKHPIDDFCKFLDKSVKLSKKIKTHEECPLKYTHVLLHLELSK